jgi:endonuclease/exonuclease/phosphatase family metal-dependent hydrolase
MPFYYLMPRGADGRRIATDLLRLRERLDAAIPLRTREESLLLATWNIREFDSTKYGSRLDDAYFHMAEVISRFDLVAIQEVRSNLAALDRLKKILGSWWSYLVTDVTEGTRGNQERMAFLFDSRKVRFGGLAGQIVLPPVRVTDTAGNRVTKPVDQLYRTPYLAAFQAGWFKFMLSTVHILWGGDEAEAPERVAEIRAVARFLSKRVADPDAWSPNLILLGDFNIFARDDATFQAVIDAGFEVPEALQSIPGSNVKKDRTYDQIAFSTHARAAVDCTAAGVFDFFQSVYRDEDEAAYVPFMGDAYHTTSSGKPRANPSTYYRAWRTFQMSDHLPMWVELKVDFGEAYLNRVAGTT